MKKLIMTGVIISSFFAVSNCYAIEANGTIMLEGHALFECAKMTEDIDHYPVNAAQSYKMYIEGFVLGYNSGMVGKSDYFSGTSGLSRYKYVLNFCRNHPLDTVLDGLLSLLNENKDNP